MTVTTPTHEKQDFRVFWVFVDFVKNVLLYDDNKSADTYHPTKAAQTSRAASGVCPPRGGFECTRTNSGSFQIRLKLFQDMTALPHSKM